MTGETNHTFVDSLLPFSSMDDSSDANEFTRLCCFTDSSAVWLRDSHPGFHWLRFCTV